MNPDEEPLKSLLKERFKPVPKWVGIPESRGTGTLTADQEYDLAVRNGQLLGDTPGVFAERRRWLAGIWEWRAGEGGGGE